MGWLGTWHFFIHWTGGDYGYNYGQLQPYDWLSGILGLTFLGALVAVYRKHACHSKGCWRLGKYPVEGTPYVVCSHCHPTVPTGGADRSHIHLMHHQAKTSNDKRATSQELVPAQEKVPGGSAHASPVRGGRTPTGHGRSGRNPSRPG